MIQGHHIFDHNASLSNFVDRLHQIYRKAKFYNNNKNLIDGLFDCSESNLSENLTYSITKTCEYLDIDTQINKLSVEPIKPTGKNQDLIINICKINNADAYVNLPGGKAIYNVADFERNSISLIFVPDYSDDILLPSNVYYSSILNLIMFYGKDAALSALNIQKRSLSI